MSSASALPSVLAPGAMATEYNAWSSKPSWGATTAANVGITVPFEENAVET